MNKIILMLSIFFSINLYATRYEVYPAHVKCVIVYDNLLRKFGYFLIYENELNDGEIIIKNYKPLSLDFIDEYINSNLPEYTYIE